MKIPRPLLHIARYLVTTAVGWLMFPLQALVVYALLFLAAIVLDGDLGGPFALVLVLIVAAAAGAIVMLTVILPAVLAGELVARRMPWPGWRWAAAPMVGGLAAFLLSIGVVAVWAQIDDLSLATAAEVWIVTLILSVLPFTAAASTAYGLAAAPPAVRWAWRRLGRLRNSFRMKRLGGADPGGAPGGQERTEHGDHDAAQQQPA